MEPPEADGGAGEVVKAIRPGIQEAKQCILNAWRPLKAKKMA